jgi:hypothetical protein
MSTVDGLSMAGEADGASALSAAVPTDEIFRATRVLAAFIVPFLVVAFYILFFRSSETKDLFAWPIASLMTARMLGAIYIGGAYFFVRVVMATRWHWIAIGFLPVTVFASFLSVATLLHWDKFTHDSIAFYAWAALYFTTPFLVLAVWWRNRVTDPGTPDADDAVLAGPVRLVMQAVGVIAFLVGTLLFLQPGPMIAVWPWVLTPLTARVVGAMFALGLTALLIGREHRWSAVRLILQAQIFMLVMVLVAVGMSWNEFDAGQAATWAFVGGLLAVIAVSVGWYLSMERRRSPASGA